MFSIIIVVDLLVFLYMIIFWTLVIARRLALYLVTFMDDINFCNLVGYIYRIDKNRLATK